MLPAVTVGTPSPDRIDAVLQYVMLAASESDDFRDHELGPIHLIKYAYLADLAHAERRDGETFEGVAWQFYHFGPWSSTVFERIEPALIAIGAERKSISSPRLSDDFIRFSLPIDREEKDRVRQRLDEFLPIFITASVSAAVREYGADTTSLLQSVYATRPMVQAAPGEILRFEGLHRPQEQGSHPATPAKLSRSQRQTLREASERVRAKLAERRSSGHRGVQVTPEPRYDRVYEEGVEWLDSLAGRQMEPINGELVVDDSVWRSPTRTEPDVP